jgi:hypothetical protein
MASHFQIPQIAQNLSINTISNMLHTRLNLLNQHVYYMAYINTSKNIWVYAEVWNYRTAKIDA